jgi:trigger factor
MWEQVAATLQRQGVPKEAYLRMSGKTEEDLLEEAKPEAERDLRREAVLAAVVEAEGIEATEEELLDAVRPTAEREKAKPEKLLARLRDRGRDEALARDIASRKALDALAEAAKPISVEQAQARDKLWTPGRGDDAEKTGTGQLWTPGS